MLRALGSQTPELQAGNAREAGLCLTDCVTQQPSGNRVLVPAEAGAARVKNQRAGLTLSMPVHAHARAIDFFVCFLVHSPTSSTGQFPVLFDRLILQL